MPTKDEYPEKYEWWINELHSLGIELNNKEQPKDLHELESLTDACKPKLDPKVQNPVQWITNTS